MNIRHISPFGLLLLFIVSVSANGGDQHTSIGLGNYLLIIFLILIVVLLAIASLRRLESKPGSLPLKQLGIAAVITIAINAIAFAFVYQEAIF